MKITLVLTGKTEAKYLSEGIAVFEKRVQRYIQFDTIVIPEIKNTRSLETLQVKEKEGLQQAKYIGESDFLVLMDEKGKEYGSVEFAGFIQQRMNSSIKNLVFLIGGAYGFSEKIYLRANAKISLSKMTFPHQLVRLIFMEQLYRAFTIIRNEPYHHEG